MMVTVKAYHYEIFGDGKISLSLPDHATVKDALNELVHRFGAEFAKRTGGRLDKALESSFKVFLNGTLLNVSSELERTLTDEDEIVLLRPVSGG